MQYTQPDNAAWHSLGAGLARGEYYSSWKSGGLGRGGGGGHDQDGCTSFASCVTGRCVCVRRRGFNSVSDNFAAFVGR